MEEECEGGGSEFDGKGDRGGCKEEEDGRLGVMEFHRAYLEGTTCPAEVCHAIIDRIRTTHTTDPLHELPDGTFVDAPRTTSTLNHFTQASADLILAQAMASKKRYEAGAPLSILDGVPVAVKDEIDVKGYFTWVGTTFLGSERFGGKKAEADGVAVERLRKLGCVILGKTTMEELGWSVFSANTFRGIPRNPYNTSKSCGGSSGVVEVPLQQGCPIALGCDGGGSVRIPAAFNGLYGLKPTHARIPAKGGFKLAHTVGVIGPMAASADDLAVAYLTMAGSHPDVSHSLLQPPVYIPRSYLKPSMKGKRFGIFPGYNEQVSNPAILRSMEVLQKRLIDAGATLVEVGIPLLDNIRMAHALVISAEIYNGVCGHPGRKEMTWANRLMMVIASLADARDYVRANQLRTILIRHLTHLFSAKVDFLLTPSTAITAPPLPADGVLARGGYSNVPLSSDAMRYVFIANFAGIPAVTVPFGMDQEGMPVGVQVMAEWWGEGGLMEVAKWIEGVAGEEGMEVGRAKMGWVGDLI
ncbi:amidase signature domain-containing protein [Chytridium lagenaria]|nr:amidase signature domain-containing protein [Chytridium lagenaria]